MEKGFRDQAPEEAADCITPSRREARRESRRDAILEVAANTFLENGYAGTTMSGIAAQLGGSKGTLWSYYPSKDVLFGAVLDRVTSAFREQLTLTLNAADPMETALTKFCTKYLTKLTVPQSLALHRLVLGEAARFPEMGRIFYERAPWKTQELLACYLEAAMARGQLRRHDPSAAAQYLISLCISQSHQQLLTGVLHELPAERIREQVEDAVAVFLRAFGT